MSRFSQISCQNLTFTYRGHAYRFCIIQFSLSLALTSQKKANISVFQKVVLMPLNLGQFSVQFSSVAQFCPTLCDPMDCSTPGFPVHHQLLELTQTHVHQVSDAIQHLILCHPLSSCLQFFPASGSFSVSQFFTLGGQSIGVSVSASVLPMNI